ncbi:MAG: DNA-processing protein DprA [Alphaproteobacteria bacterium]|nr:DNA-processing protein DprA [Alphaproteobacteria bacterium]
MLSHGERRDRLRLARTENVGPVTFRQLLLRFGTASAALAALPELARKGGRRAPLAIAAPAKADQELDWHAAAGFDLVIQGDPDYPRQLLALEDPPAVFSIAGSRHLLARPMVAIVGARNASANALNFANRLARDLAEAGVVVVSGLARGIDGAAHGGALRADTLDAATIAVIAGGIDTLYPPEHAALQEEIAARGAVVAEMPPGTQAMARHFPRRNRIISGLSLGVIVVEATEKSGSLITARYAADQGREVFAVPGSPLDPRCKGPNRLLREGAHLTESAADVLSVLKDRSLAEPAGSMPPALPPTPITADQLDTARAQVLVLLGPSPVHVDEVIRRCQLSPAVVLTVLLELELAGRLDRQAGNRVALIDSA